MVESIGLFGPMSPWSGLVSPHEKLSPSHSPCPSSLFISQLKCLLLFLNSLQGIIISGHVEHVACINEEVSVVVYNWGTHQSGREQDPFIFDEQTQRLLLRIIWNKRKKKETPLFFRQLIDWRSTKGSSRTMMTSENEPVTPAAAAITGPPPSSTHNKVKFMCSHGGKILPRPPDSHLKYVGGETRVISVSRDINFSGMESLCFFRFKSCCNWMVTYQWMCLGVN